MPYNDLREYLAALKQAGKLKRVAKEVDKDWEVAAGAG
jgi:UbiD family decarboxylase